MFESLLKGTNLPFTTRVMEFPLPTKFKMLQVEFYYSNKDPLDHIETYKAHMFFFQGSPKEIMGRAFLTTLRGPALRWFESLPCKSVDSLNDMSVMLKKLISW